MKRFHFTVEAILATLLHVLAIHYFPEKNDKIITNILYSIVKSGNIFKVI